MSVLVIAKIPGDMAAFQKALVDRADEFAAIGKRAREAGAMHHRFGVADGYVLAIDEWQSPADFEKFFGDPAMQEFVASVGGDTSAQPELTVTEAISSPDEF